MCENVHYSTTQHNEKKKNQPKEHQKEVKKKVHPDTMKPLKRIRDPYIMTKKNIYNVLYDEKIADNMTEF